AVQFKVVVALLFPVGQVILSPGRDFGKEGHGVVPEAADQLIHGGRGETPVMGILNVGAHAFLGVIGLARLFILLAQLVGFPFPLFGLRQLVLDLSAALGN